MKHKTKRISFAALLFFGIVLSLNLKANTIFVNSSASGSNNGTSWTNAYTSLQSALDVAVANDEIWVAKGTYKPSADYGLGGSRYYHFRMTEGVEIYGGFPNTGDPDMDDRDLENNETILSGDLSSNDIFDVTNGGYQGTSGDDNCYHVLYHPNGLNLTSAAVLDGFTISGGNANGAANPHNRAGGLYLYSSSPTIRNVIFESNVADNLGGAVYIYNFSSVFDNISFVNNISGGGGGMYISYASPLISNAIFTGNTSAADGGALSTHSSSPIITNAIFSDNTAKNNGGAIIFYSSSVQYNTIINNVSLSNNQAGGSGGAIRFASTNAASTLNLNNCIVWDNTATTSGNELSLVSTGTTTLNYSCYKNQTNDVEVLNGTLLTTNFNITSDPLFVDAAGGDYSIQGASPCVNTGNNTYNSLPVDIRGETRIQNTTIDMGAYEWTDGTDPYWNGTIIYVDVSSSGGNNTGQNWDNAFTSLQSALDIAIPGLQIWVAKGIYKPSSSYDLTNTSRYYHFRLKEGVEIYGGFAGTETSVEQRINFGSGETNETILSGDLNGDDNFDIENGGYQGTTGDDNCYHVLYHPNGLNLTSATVFDGFTVKGGNANGASDPHNKAGGLFLYSSSPTIRNVIFESNVADNLGGAVYIYNFSSVFDNISFVNNISGGGGGMYISYASPLISNAIFTGNTSAADGGALSTHSSSPIITNAIFSDNTATNNGGAIIFYSSSVQFNATINNVSLSDNQAGISGGAIRFASNNAASTLNLNNCIVWDNTATTSGNELSLVSTGTTTLNYSCYKNQTNDVEVLNGTLLTTNFNITSDPLFVDAAGGDYSIQGASPCVNTGNNTYNSLPVDIRGETRIQNTTIDMGAYEWTDGTDPYWNGTIIYVDVSSSGGNNTGQNWDNAFTSLQSALDIAIPGLQIWVAKGIYKPSSSYDLTNTSRYYHFRLKEGVEIYGGFAGTETSVEQRINFGSGETNETILSGDLNGDDNFDIENGGYQGTTGDDNCYHVFYHPSGTNLDNSASLNGFTIRGGNANDNGGGMLNDGSSPTLEQINFKENSAALGGGGINNNNSSSPLILNCVFRSNISANSGGALDIWNSSNATIINCLFYQNNSYAGGAIMIANANPTITNATICQNTATLGGGLYCVFGGSPELNNCIMWDNAATSGNQIYLGSLAGETILNYSCYSNSANDIVISGGTFTTTNNNINSDPDFANADAGDFRLISNSPAINTGLNSYNSQTNDIRGELRIQDVTIDMGAYEWTSGVDPQLVFVNTLASGANDGSSWLDAFISLQSALNIVASGDRIWVAKGTYKPSYAYGYAGGPRQYHFELLNNLEVYGGFAGTESTIEERANFGPGESNETVLSGDIGVIGDLTDNCYHVIFNWNNGNNSLLDGFTVKLGNASEGMTTSWGGGLHFNNVSGNLQNMTFESNYGILGGGIFLWKNSTLTATNLLVKSNCATSGAGICSSSSTVNLINASLNNNDASNEGGAIFMNGTSIVAINNSILWGNHAQGNGNEIFIDGGNVGLNYCCFSNSSGDISNPGGTFNPQNCKNSDPLFVNTSTGDLRLFGNSLCVNSGSNSDNTLSTDIRGEARIQNTAIDMGAYEWTEGVDPSTNVITWTGNTDFDWNESGNWSGNVAPTQAYDVVIPNVGNDPVVNQNPDNPATCKNLTIQSGAVLSVAAGKALTVAGVLNNNAGNAALILKSDATGTASLIHETSGVSATIERFTPMYVGAAGWHDISSPVAAQAIRPGFVPNENPIPGSNDFYKFDEIQNLWINTKDDIGNWNSSFEDGFVVGRGYNVAYAENETKSFAGELSVGDFTFNGSTIPAITYTADGGIGWNLMGNPYASALDWNLCSKTNIDASVYAYDGDAGQYVSWNGSIGALDGGIIPPMNAFFIKASANPELTIPNSSRVHTSTNFYKDKTFVKDLLVLKVEGNGFSDQTYIHFNENATLDFDQNLDAYKLLGISEAPQLYTKVGDSKLSINVLPYTSEEMVIPLGLNVGQENEYIIKVSDNTYWETVDISLKDLETGNIYNLKTNNSISINQSSTIPDRFLLLINGATYIEENIRDNSIEIYSYGNQILIKSDEPYEVQVSVFNLLGQSILHRTMTGSETLSGLDTGFYLVVVTTEKATKTKKVFIR